VLCCVSWPCMKQRQGLQFVAEVGVEDKAMPDLVLLLRLQVSNIRPCWLPCLRSRASALSCVVALHEAAAGPLVCRGDGCEGKASLSIYISYLVLLYSTIFYYYFTLLYFYLQV